MAGLVVFGVVDVGQPAASVSLTSLQDGLWCWNVLESPGGSSRFYVRFSCSKQGVFKR